jgi:type IV secretory pathway VirB2 component (pilin)
LIALLVAATVLIGYVLPDAFAANYRGQRTPVYYILAEWAVIVGSFALLLGLWNLGRVHVKKAFRQRRIESVFFLFSALATLLLWIAVIFSPAQGVSELAEGAVQGVYSYVISPVGASLAALVVVTLALAAFRLMRERRSMRAAFLFVPVVIVTLLTTIPLAGLNPELFSGIRHWVINVLGMAGMRGLLLGVVLGTAVTALRFLLPRREM